MKKSAEWTFTDTMHRLLALSALGSIFLTAYLAINYPGTSDSESLVTLNHGFPDLAAQIFPSGSSNLSGEYENENSIFSDLYSVDLSLEFERVKKVAKASLGSSYKPGTSSRSVLLKSIFEKINQSEMVLPLERTGDVAYNDFSLFDPDDKRKFFMYSPSGGFNNQRKELEWALKIGEDLKRHVVIPMAGKHTTWWTRYKDIEPGGLVPMDIVLDIPRLEQTFSHFVILDVPVEDLKYQFALLRAFISKLESHQVETLETFLAEAESTGIQFKYFGDATMKNLRFIFNSHYSHGRDNELKRFAENFLTIVEPKKRAYWAGTAEVLENLGKTSDKFLMLRGSSMYHPWYPQSEMKHYQLSVVFSPYLRRYAAEMGKVMLEKSPSFGAAHVRLGDYVKHGRLPDVHSIYADLIKAGLNSSQPLYIATEPHPHEKFVRYLLARFDTVYLSGSPRFQWLLFELQKQFSKSLSYDILGMIEQMVCVLAKVFAGTRYSNFSKQIAWMRKESLIFNYFPELEEVMRQLVEAGEG